MDSQPPGFTSRQLLTQLFHIRDDTLGFLLECGQRFGRLTHFQAGNQNAYFLNHPDLIKYVLQDNHRNYTKNTIQYNALATITGRGLLTSDGPTWLRNRRLEQPAFSRTRLASLDQVVLPAVENMLRHWEGQPGPLDIDSEMMKLTLEIVGKALFSIELRRDAQKLTAAVLTALDHIVHRARNPIDWPDAVPTPRNRRFQAALRTLDEAVFSIIAQRKGSGQPGTDLLGMLLQARDEETGQMMDDRQIRDEVITLLIAGHETVASALTWCWYLLACNPDAGQQLRAETSRVLAGRQPATADLPSLPYAGQVFSEALRLYPPAWLITRQSIETDLLDGFSIPPHSLIIISPYALQRTPAFWPEPERFNPQRFIAENPPSRFSYIPFGGGPRLCIGNQFAQIEAILILARISQSYRMDLVSNIQVQVDALVTLRPRGGLAMLPVRL